VELEGGQRLEADLVVDASGLGSRTARLVSDLGCGDAEENRVDLLSATATRLFRPAPGIPAPDWVAVFVRAAPGNPRVGALTRIEGGLWRLSLSGLGGLYPGKTAEAFMEFTRALPSPEIFQLVRDAEPASPIYYYGCSFSRWVRYDRLARFPDGIVVVGDAVFHANPEWAQGMTFCLMAAETLGAMLADSARPLGARRGFSLAFQRRMARKYRPYWLWNAAAELHLPGIVDRSGLGRLERYQVEFYRRLRSFAPRDGALLCAAMKVSQLERRPSSLLQPSMLWRVAHRAASG
jgi:2-polyprenyl-6-methoxyphenol hydroxylase-like FAD-dependent oxidoreductase